MEDDFTVMRAVALYHNWGTKVCLALLPSFITQPCEPSINSNARCRGWPLMNAFQSQVEVHCQA
jgi:hypothetical protein